MKWVFRILGWLLTWLGMQMMVGPLTVFPDIVRPGLPPPRPSHRCCSRDLVDRQIPVVGPCLGDIIGCMLCVMTCMASFGISVSTTISFASSGPEVKGAAVARSWW